MSIHQRSGFEILSCNGTIDILRPMPAATLAARSENRKFTLSVVATLMSAGFLVMALLG